MIIKQQDIRDAYHEWYGRTIFESDCPIVDNNAAQKAFLAGFQAAIDIINVQQAAPIGAPFIGTDET